MAIESKIETNGIIPRNYGLSFENNGTTFLMFPSQYFLAATLMSEEKAIDERLKAYQNFKKIQLSKSHTRPEYPMFKLGESSSLLDLEFNELKDLLLEKISKKDGVKTLYIDGGESAVTDPFYGTVVLTGKVRSKHDARNANAQKYRDTKIINPVLNDFGTIGFSDLSCSCDNAFWEETKQRAIKTSCYHVAALNMFFYDNSDKVKSDHKGKFAPAIPFSISPSKLRENSFLDMDVLFSYYVLDETHYQINRKLMPIGFMFFHPVMQKMIMMGRANYEVISAHKEKAKVPESYMKQENDLVSKLYSKLYKEGYRREGLCVEHSGTKYEAVATRFTRKEDGNMISLVTPTKKLPPYMILKKPLGQRQMYKTPLDIEEHPFYRLNKNRKGFDDMTRRDVEERIFLPGTSKSGVYIPEKVFERYRKAKAMLKKSK